MPDPKGKLVTPVGFRSDGSIHSLLLDTNDRLITSPYLHEFSDSIADTSSSTSTGAGSTTVNGLAVPSNTQWMITAFMAYHDDTVTRAIYLYVNDVSAGKLPSLYYNGAAPSGSPVGLSPCNLLLQTGDYLYVLCLGLANTKHLYIQAWGSVISL